MLMQAEERPGISTSANLLLSRLSPADGVLLRPHLEAIPVPRGTRLLEQAHRIDSVYFPEAGLVALEEDLGRGPAVEVAIVGREGLLGWPALLGCERSVHAAISKAQDGRALRIATEPLLAACRASATLWASLLAFVQDIMSQMARTIVAQSDGSLEQRIARWLLMRHDRVGGDQIMARHSEIADAINVRRASITDRLHVLEGDRLIRCRRGRIIVRDRDRLIGCAGNAYGDDEAPHGLRR